MSFGSPLTAWIYDRSPPAVQDLIVSEYSRRRGLRKFGVEFDEHLAELERIQAYDSAKLKSLQDEKIRRTIWHANRYVPHYTKQFAEICLLPEEVEERTDLSQLPLLTKETVQAEAENLRSILYSGRAAEIIHSSGTSGKAISVAVAPGYLKLEKAYLWLQRRWCGLKPGDRTAYFTGHPVVPIPRKKPPFWVHDRAEGRTLFSLQHLSEQNLAAYAAELERFDPELLVGYPTAIYLMAAYLQQTGNRSIRPRGIFTASETVLPHQREMIEAAFGSRLLDLYGQTEYCGMIMQCEKGSYHIQETYGVVEILDPNGAPSEPGEIGEIVATGLNNMAMPLLRYRLGDTAIPRVGSCNCGRGGRLVECIVGRIEDTIVLPDGRLLTRLDFVFKELPEIKEAQLIQETLDRVRIRLVPGRGFTSAQRLKVEENFRARAGNDIRLEFEVVSEIPRLSNGKFRFVISKVSVLPTIRQTGEVLSLASEEEKTL